jgi:glycerophosphoryl diester phosphodiesterase
MRGCLVISKSGWARRRSADMGIWWAEGSMKVLSHRGYHVDVPENTMEAFERALAMGVDGIETDVWISGDGIPILFHDRLTRDGREVTRVSKAALEEAVGYAVPSLEDLEGLIARSRPETLWNLELKEPRAVEVVVELVRRQKGSSRFLVSSFWHPAVVQAAREPGIECGLLVAHYPLTVEQGRAGMGLPPGIRTMVWDFDRADAALVREATRHGVRSFVFGAVTPADHTEVASWGVEGIITDRPEYVLNKRS